MLRLTIASQWPEDLNRKLIAAIEQDIPSASVVRVSDWHVPADADVLLANANHARLDDSPAPAGWPYSLKHIQLISSGTDGYPSWVLDNDSYSVASSRGTSAVPMAEFVLAAIFAKAKKLPELWVTGPDQWKHTMLDTVSGSRLGLFGLGALGQEVARRALAIGMTVSAVRRNANAAPIPGIEMVSSLDELIAISDHLVLLAPATAATRHVINADSLKRAKPNLHLINVARGSLVDQDALLAALDAGTLARATLDVSDPEPLPAGHRLYAHPQVKLSPHTSVVSAWVFNEIVAKAARNIRAWRLGAPIEDRIEPDAQNELSSR